MKNLFVITEEEKNRILSLHESATKNQYLVNETLSANDMGGTAVTLDTQSQSLTLKSSLSMEDSRNIIGKLELKLNQGVTFVRLSSDRLIAKNTPYQKVGDATGIVKTEGTNDIIYYCATKLFQVKGETEKYIGENFPSGVQESFDNLCESIKVAAKPEASTWEQVVTKFPCLANEKDKNIYNNGSYDYVKAKLDGVDFIIFIGDGHIYNPTEGKFTEIYLGKNYPCNPVVMTDPEKKDETKVQKGGQENPNVTRIKDLQTKVGLENTGTLDQATLKAIMDKLSQKV